MHHSKESEKGEGMAEGVKYKGFEIHADGFGKDGGDRWQPTLYITRHDAASGETKEKQIWTKYPKQFYDTRAGAAAVALIAGKAVIDGKIPGTRVDDI